MSKDKNQLFEEMNTLWSDFQENHNAPTKVSDAKARKSIGELKKLVTDYRKASVAANK